jgi:hypothetical protein
MFEMSLILSMSIECLFLSFFQCEMPVIFYYWDYRKFKTVQPNKEKKSQFNNFICYTMDFSIHFISKDKNSSTKEGKIEADCFQSTAL